MKSAEGLVRGIHKRVSNAYLVIVKTIDWPTVTCTVEFKESPGLLAKGRIWTVSGTKGTLYPPLAVGDVCLAIVTGADLTEMIQTKTARRPNNPYFFDKSDVLVLPGVFTEGAEPAGRKASAPPTDGNWLLVASDGSEIRFDGADWVWKLSGSGKLYIGGKTNAGPVSLQVGYGTQDKLYVGDP